jgi:predicted PurR-regulated permease PerM
MYIGSQLFGFIGIFLLPILMIIVKLLNDEGVIHLWKPSSQQETVQQE